MTISHDQFSKRFATVRFIMGAAFQEHFVGKPRRPETAARILSTARRQFKEKGMAVTLDASTVKWLGWMGNYTGLEVIATIDGQQQKIVMDTAIAARRMRGEA